MRTHPHHDTHGGSVINDNDQRADHQHDDTCNYYCPLGPDDEPADVTVSDLLDACDVDNDHQLAQYYDLCQRADRDILHAFARVRGALRDYRALSPEERAEFDRRTT